MNRQAVDLFLTSIVDAPVKDNRALMEFPHFSLEKQPRFEPFVYEDKDRGIKIEIKPGHNGMATIWDKDVLIYCASLINDMIERGETPQMTLQFHAYDFLRLTGRGTGKRAYELLLAALDRLQSTSIRTTITSGTAEERERTFFSWVENARVLERKNKNGDKVMQAVQVTLNPWLFRALVEDRAVLTINSSYFRLTKGIERRLYEIARKHCGHQNSWTISLEKLWRKCGSTMELRFFKRTVKQIIERQSLPDYDISASFDKAAGSFMREMAPPQLSRRWGRNEKILVTFTRKQLVGTSIT